MKTSALPALRRALEIRELGTVDYLSALELQKSALRERAAGERPDTLFLLEHPPVYTRGTTARGQSAPELPHPLHDVQRGGDITYHGPGQLVGYAVVHLKERGLTIGRHLRMLEETLVRALARMGAEARALPGFTGVWVGEKKIASIGVGARAWVAYHGFALNVRTEMAPFRAVHPCRLEPETMTSLHALRPDATMEAARAAVRAAFCDVYGAGPWS
ncbi:MAG: lipoyl(octanoyl) transferase LipB [Elusimicrobiota bacterium]|jgi:lipoyl(octanoyl) transferase